MSFQTSNSQGVFILSFCFEGVLFRLHRAGTCDYSILMRAHVVNVLDITFFCSPLLARLFFSSPLKQLCKQTTINNHETNDTNQSNIFIYALLKQTSNEKYNVFIPYKNLFFKGKLVKKHLLLTITLLLQNNYFLTRKNVHFLRMKTLHFLLLV